MEKIYNVMKNSGIVSIVIGIVIVIQMMGLIPSSGVATGLSGIKLVIGIAANFILGALMTAGVGMYAPCLALVCLLGINPMIAFPIMMGSSAYLMPVASLKFIKGVLTIEKHHLLLQYLEFLEFS